MSSVAELVEAARNDALPLDAQHGAFTELVRLFEEMAFATSLRLLDDAEEARDATQEAFLTAWKKLRALREPEAFGGWLKRLIVTQCNRRRRSAHDHDELTDVASAVTERELDRRDKQRLLARAFAQLPAGELRAIVLFYFLGRTLNEIASLLEIPRATVGKRLYAARLKIRRRLPASVRAELIELRPSASFIRKVREGLFDEYLGDYRFDRRPDLVVRVVREGDFLVSYGAGQRNVLATIGEGAFVTSMYDGEGRFERDRRGHISRFVYYEFGKRLGVAKKIRLTR